jgi:hypothetical protein
MTRRNLWSTPPVPTGDQLTVEVLPPATMAIPSPAASPAMDLLRMAPLKSRKRDWEKQRQVQTATYRGIPPELQAELRAEAQALGVPLDELASVFLQHGLQTYQAGELSLSPIFQAHHLTLFPSKEQTLPALHSKRSAKSHGGRWKHVVSYRYIAPEVQTGIKSVAQQLHVPVGEVAATFLRHTLAAYRAGTLKLNPQPRATRLTLGP